MSRIFGIPEVCPGCHKPIVSGAMADATIEAAERYERVLGLMRDVTADDCDAAFVGDVITNGELPCPLCGTNCYVEIDPPMPRVGHGDDRDFLDEVVVDLELSLRTRSLIYRAGAKTVADLLALSASDLRRVVPAVSDDVESQITEIREFLSQRCLRLNGEDDDVTNVE